MNTPVLIPASRTIAYFIPDGYPTFRPDIAALFGRYLPEQGVFSDLITQTTEQDGERAAWGGGELLASKWSDGRASRKFGGVLNDLRHLFAPKANWDAIQVRDKPLFAAIALVRARMARKPFFFWMSFPISEAAERVAKLNGSKVGLARLLNFYFQGRVSTYALYKFVLPRSDHVFVQSDKMREDLVARGIDRAKMTPVPMGFDPDRFTQIAPQQAGAAPTLVYLGACDRIRRIDFLFDVMALLKPEWPSLTLKIVGDAQEDADRAWMREEIERRGLSDSIRITGWVAPEIAQRELITGEICLAIMAPDPLLDSATPTKLVEYMALGKPVVANDHPDQNYLLTASGAGYCTPFEPEAFAEGVAKLLRDPVDARKRGLAGREKIAELRAYPKIGERLAAVYFDLLPIRMK